MRPAARLQAAIELLDEIIIAARDNGASADNIAKKFFKARRYAGSGDRRKIRELVYEAIRRFGERPENGRAAMVALAKEIPGLAQLFDGSDYGPATITENEPVADGSNIPDWLKGRFVALIDDAEKAALFDRAALDIRINPKKALAADVATIWPEAEKLPLPNAWRLPTGTSVEASEGYGSGAIEIQDLGSQAIVAACLLNEPELVLDLCAGAGGKTLGMAAQFKNDARIIAADTDRNRLSRIEPRMRRAGARNIETLLLAPNKEMDALSQLNGICDIVLVDAPCTGTGTWRRNPELRWRMTPKRLQQTVQLQQRLLQLGSELVKSGGRLVYAVCSLLDEEGGDQTEVFLANNPGWRHIDVDLPIGRPYRRGILLSPYHDGTDGFYFTCLEKL
ncbi:RsmB/NOP family class I SAM-dependent RNA methyltransferase [Parasphingorhabdus halotolerans]|uniref:RsmB/NOP family class I SAM-dependent RNA methyltransferase n=1 Tax=Parasphingorhabdus halotolerans TaxID=2725558 RepID=A0A6H2DIX0_9SPHN|nr:RsmB/NOP family class I SAM-dependent RNA methyltransferase [Parasphingorhabdus halotolerans]QJB67933.1 RsmB/NOP family class I SAM-dependent RNA methyltransferase [Parasphingorhabdus halotolerans]